MRSRQRREEPLPSSRPCTCVGLGEGREPRATCTAAEFGFDASVLLSFCVSIINDVERQCHHQPLNLASVSCTHSQRARAMNLEALRTYSSDLVNASCSQSTLACLFGIYCGFFHKPSA